VGGSRRAASCSSVAAVVSPNSSRSAANVEGSAQVASLGAWPIPVCIWSSECCRWRRCAIERVQTRLVESLNAIEMQYERQETCGEPGLTFAQLQISDALRSCALVDPTLGAVLNQCDGAPTGP